MTINKEKNKEKRDGGMNFLRDYCTFVVAIAMMKRRRKKSEIKKYNKIKIKTHWEKEDSEEEI